MFGIIKKIMGDSPPDESPVKQGDAHVALCVLMIEAAHIDGECSDEEMAHVIATLTDKCGVSKDDIDELVERAYKQREDSIDLFTFTRYINQN